METYLTEASLMAQTIPVGRTALTKGRDADGDGLGTKWLIQASGTGLILANGNVAVQQQYTPAKEAIVTGTPPAPEDGVKGDVWYVLTPDFPVSLSTTITCGTNVDLVGFSRAAAYGSFGSMVNSDYWTTLVTAAMYDTLSKRFTVTLDSGYEQSLVGNVVLEGATDPLTDEQLFSYTADNAQGSSVWIWDVPVADQTGIEAAWIGGAIVTISIDGAHI